MKKEKTRIFGWLSGMKLKQKMRYFFLLITLSYLVLFILLYVFYLRGNMTEYMKKSNKDTLVSTSNSFIHELDRVSTLSHLIIKNNFVRNYLKADQGDLQLARDAMSVLYDFNSTINNISSIYVIRLDGEFFNVSNSITNFNQEYIKEEAWISKIADRSGGCLISINGDGVFHHRSNKPLISMLRMIYDVDSQQPIGYLAINFFNDMLYSVLSGVEGEDKLLSFYTADGTVICDDILGEKYPDINIGAGEIGQYEMNKNGRQEIVSYYQIPDTPLILVSIEKTSIFKYVSWNIILIFIAVLLVFGAGMTGIGVFVSKTITTPIERLSQSMSNVKTGWLHRVSIDLPNDEIGHLKVSYNNMLVEINRLIEQLVEKETQAQRAELEILQEQIKPHFLYNTLDTIGYLALEKPRDEVYDAIETLGNFYRKFLSKGSNEIELREEVAIIRDYLTLQKLRYDNIIKDIYEIDEALMEYGIPKLILQPLVENSIYHGIRLKGECGIIKISAYEKEEILFIHVYDNGIGMSQDQMKNLLMKNNSRSFGFKGTIERIQYFYDRKDVYEIRSEEGEYCEVILKLPARRKKYV